MMCERCRIGLYPAGPTGNRPTTVGTGPPGKTGRTESPCLCVPHLAAVARRQAGTDRWPESCGDCIRLEEPGEGICDRHAGWRFREAVVDRGDEDDVAALVAFLSLPTSYAAPWWSLVLVPYTPSRVGGARLEARGSPEQLRHSGCYPSIVESGYCSVVAVAESCRERDVGSMWYR